MTNATARSSRLLAGGYVATVTVEPPGIPARSRITPSSTGHGSQEFLRKFEAVHRKATDYDGVSSYRRPDGNMSYVATLSGTLKQERVSEKLGEEIYDMILLRQAINHIEEMRRRGWEKKQNIPG